jgi:hypothetical protein
VGADIIIDSNTLLVTDFMNLKIKPTQFFKGTHRDMMYMYIFIEVSDHLYFIYTLFIKKIWVMSSDGTPLQLHTA